MQPIIPPTNGHNNSKPKLLLPEAKNNSKIRFDRAVIANLDKILFAIGSIYLIIVIFWLTNKKTIIFPRLSQSSNATKIKQKQKISKSDLEFINYTTKSLIAIDRKIAARKSEIKPKNSQQTKIIERIYIPVESPSQANYSDRLNVPVPPSINGKPTLFPPQTSSRQTVSIKESNDTHVLVGLLELGKNSVALVSINGETQRIKIGQKIGKSGWVLIGAVDRQAKISRYGKIRLIATGEEI